MTLKTCPDCGRDYAGEVCVCEVPDHDIPIGGFKIGVTYARGLDGRFVKVETSVN